MTGGGGAEVVVGHSFGGKQALAFLMDVTAHKQFPPPSHVFLLDTVPCEVARPGAGEESEGDSVKSVIDAVSSVGFIAGKKELVASLTAKGVDPGIAMWMTTNCKPSPTGSGLVFAFDVPTIRSLYAAYTSSDYAPFLSSLRGPTTVHLVKATRNPAWKNVEKRMEEVEGCEWVKVHEVDAGHWLHTEAQKKVVDIILPALRGPGA